MLRTLKAVELNAIGKGRRGKPNVGRAFSPWRSPFSPSLSKPHLRRVANGGAGIASESL